MKDIAVYNRAAWDAQVTKRNRWTVPVSVDVISKARAGDWQVVLTPTKPVPESWFPDLSGADLLGLASGGGQQAPVLAAAGAKVTVLDNSPNQLEQDQVVARREGLSIRSVLGDMRDLSCFADNSFDVVFNPCSVCFVPDVRSVFMEVSRVLRPGGRLLAGFVHPIRFMFDENDLERDKLTVRHRLPYADETHLSAEELDQLRTDSEPLCFSHSLEDLIGGQLQAGLRLKDIFEDKYSDDLLSEYSPTFIATSAEKPW
ncbi:class I SAM-dependent methyltransferase [Rhodopirellula sp. JC740]|uniref:Class I SAM-dependent methyltransferase n=1 Tax=Rhodopirellula halodulae TaxID=2894198 RepID=A0ABS8NII6_9BACT|nr:class I SAM-dependent methyltransferase [Rhodopirellula sp. JC740]MCC9642296.1 class I SAM-dependent methyltransferase [Rhodopirellula sp. JC740]